MPTTHHILRSASNLLGNTLLIIAGMHITNVAGRTFADEVAWVGAFCFSTSCTLSYLAIRTDGGAVRRFERAADTLFLIGLLSLVVSVAMVGFLRFG